MNHMSFLADPYVLVAMLVAAVAGFRLWQTLGTRPPNDVRPVAYQTQPLPGDLELKAREVQPRQIWQGVAEQGSSLAKTLEEIAGRDDKFEGKAFFESAKAAHEHILEAFAKGDLAALKPLLAENTQAVFAAEIDRRKQSGETAVFNFIGIKQAAIRDARVMGSRAEIDVAFTTEIVSALKNAAGATITGDDKRIATVKELWSYGRSLTDPADTWRLVETHEQP
jgi:predicted lipid-binding transport protein (Tim44 family)